MPTTSPGGGARQRRHRGRVHRRSGARQGPGDGAPVRLQHRHPAQGAPAHESVGQRPRPVCPATDAPAPGAPAEASPGADLAAADQLLEAAGDRLIDARNRALLALGYDTLLRRSELVSLEVPDVLEEIDGTATVLVRASKTDADGRGATLYLARDTVQLVKTWLDRGGVDDGRVFRSVRKEGTVGEHLDASQVPRIYKQMARHAGLPDDIVDTLAGHSTRVGPVQDMIAGGIELPAILQAGRWQTTRMVHRYGERLLARRSGAAQLAERQQR